jgi:two-component system, chemotaxis family, protein-glutamate methylesterase/glutaminase
MKPIRVLVVDDSVVVRRIVRDALAEDPTIEICGVAANGRIALALIDQCCPDIVTLDIEMPEMDGLEMLRHLRRQKPMLPVIMFSTLTQRGAVATLDALALGASDYVAKPANVGSVKDSIDSIRNELCPKIKALCGMPVAVSLPSLPSTSNVYVKPPARSVGSWPIDIVAIGTSTGGPNALAEVLPQLPKDLPAAVVVVQHMPPTFTRFLAERLNGQCQLAVSEAVDEEPLRPGKVVIAPGDFHMAVEQRGTNTRIRTLRTAPENSCRPSVDVLFRSVARVYGSCALGVVMTGMGQDGLRGAGQLHDAGAKVLAQDEATSVVWGMPGFVVQAGLAEKVLPLREIANEIVRRVRESHRVPPIAKSDRYVHQFR